MKIALVRVTSYQSWYRLPSIGLGYLAAALERRGIEVKIFDGRYFSIDDRKLVEDIIKFAPAIIGFTAMTNDIKRTVMVADDVKKRFNAPIVIGGCHITALPIKTLEDFPVIDYGVIGEGEDTLLDIVEYINGQRNIGDIEGIVYRDGGKIIQSRPRKPIMDLDRLMFPAFHHYFQRGKKNFNRNTPYYQLFTSRGCPFHCTFCMRVLGNTVRRRSSENILEEVNFAIKEYGADTINFADEIFLFNDERTREILNRFIENGINKKIRWTAQTRADLINQKLANLAKRAGCYRLEIGVESGNNDILKSIGKNITVERVESAVKTIKKEGIGTAAYYIFGHPGEKEETIRQTIELAVRLNTDTIAVGIMVPYPGTKIYEWARECRFGYRLTSTDWDDYDKFGRPALEIDGLPMNKLESFQRRAYIYFYLKNFRLFDLLKFVISRYKGIFAVLKTQLIVTRPAPTKSL